MAPNPTVPSAVDGIESPRRDAKTIPRPKRTKKLKKNLEILDVKIICNKMKNYKRLKKLSSNCDTVNHLYEDCKIPFIFIQVLKANGLTHDLVLDALRALKTCGVNDDRCLPVFSRQSSPTLSKGPSPIIEPLVCHDTKIQNSTQPQHPVPEKLSFNLPLSPPSKCQPPYQHPSKNYKESFLNPIIFLCDCSKTFRSKCPNSDGQITKFNPNFTEWCAKSKKSPKLTKNQENLEVCGELALSNTKIYGIIKNLYTLQRYIDLRYKEQSPFNM